MDGNTPTSSLTYMSQRYNGNNLTQQGSPLLLGIAFQTSARNDRQIAMCELLPATWAKYLIDLRFMSYRDRHRPYLFQAIPSVLRVMAPRCLGCCAEMEAIRVDICPATFSLSASLASGGNLQTFYE
jgi:hypothetical protein